MNKPGNTRRIALTLPWRRARLLGLVLGGALLALALGGCGGGEGVVSEGADSEPTGLAAGAALEPSAEAEDAAAQVAPEGGADKATRLYNWARHRSPYLRGRSSGEIKGRVYADVYYKQGVSNGYYYSRNFHITLETEDRRKGEGYRMWAATSKPCSMVLDGAGGATVEGAAYFDRYADGHDARLGDYRLVLSDRGNSQTPRDHVTAYYRSGSSTWRQIASFDCTYQGAYGGDLIVKSNAASAW